MKSGSFMQAVATISLVGGFATSASALSPPHQPQGLKSSVLSAVHPSSGGGPARRSRGVPSKTARESAFNVEWEPMTELERRIEDGVNYEHLPNEPHRRAPASGKSRKSKPDDDIPLAKGVFCGYRYTTEEYDRLRSARPTD